MARRSSLRFSPSEIERMEKLLAEKKDKVVDQSFCQKITEEFNRFPGRVGSRALQATQVQGWFLDKLPTMNTKATCSPVASEEKVLASGGNFLAAEEKVLASGGKVLDSEEKDLASGGEALASEEKVLASGGEVLASDKIDLASKEKVLASDTSLSNAADGSPDLKKEERDKVPEVAELEFEARSARDEAWYDVAIFLAHRWNNSGEVEVRVRFQGFGAEDDEWVNVKKAVRERSIPLESFECQKVNVGDLVLCFKEGSEEALHFDAHVLEIQRKQHDIRGCRCIFLIRYDHDQSEERVHLRRMCRRPKY